MKKPNSPNIQNPDINVEGNQGYNGIAIQQIGTNMLKIDVWDSGVAYGPFFVSAELISGFLVSQMLSHNYKELYNLCADYCQWNKDYIDKLVTKVENTEDNEV